MFLQRPFGYCRYLLCCSLLPSRLEGKCLYLNNSLRPWPQRPRSLLSYCSTLLDRTGERTRSAALLYDSRAVLPPIPYSRLHRGKERTVGFFQGMGVQLGAIRSPQYVHGRHGGSNHIRPRPSLRFTQPFLSGGQRRRSRILHRSVLRGFFSLAPVVNPWSFSGLCPSPA